MNNHDNDHGDSPMHAHHPNRRQHEQFHAHSSPSGNGRHDIDLRSILNDVHHHSNLNNRRSHHHSNYVASCSRLMLLMEC